MIDSHAKEDNYDDVKPMCQTRVLVNEFLRKEHDCW